MSKPSRHLLRGAELAAARAVKALDPNGLCECGHVAMLHYGGQLLCVYSPPGVSDDGSGQPCRCPGFRPGGVR